MTFANRRRFIRLLWAFVSNASLPFIFGWVFSLITMSQTMLDTAQAFDKSGLDICVKQGATNDRH